MEGGGEQRQGCPSEAAGGPCLQNRFERERKRIERVIENEKILKDAEVLKREGRISLRNLRLLREVHEGSPRDQVVESVQESFMDYITNTLVECGLDGMTESIEDSIIDSFTYSCLKQPTEGMRNMHYACWSLSDAITELKKNKIIKQEKSARRKLKKKRVNRICRKLEGTL